MARAKDRNAGGRNLEAAAGIRNQQQREAADAVQLREAAINREKCEHGKQH
jgi:hypothetical protein